MRTMNPGRPPGLALIVRTALTLSIPPPRMKKECPPREPILVNRDEMPSPESESPWVANDLRLSLHVLVGPANRCLVFCLEGIACQLGRVGATIV